MKTFLRLILLVYASINLNTQVLKAISAPQDLFKEIASMDSIVFQAFNTQNMLKFKSLFTDDLEWYQDNQGLIPYEKVFETFDDNFHKASKLRRELVKGSLEVHPIKNYGALEIGIHRFSHIENGKEIVGTFKFIMIWKKTDDGWKISRVISYDH